jgi:hypothetical protein
MDSRSTPTNIFRTLAQMSIVAFLSVATRRGEQ